MCNLLGNWVAGTPRKAKQMKTTTYNTAESGGIRNRGVVGYGFHRAADGATRGTLESEVRHLQILSLSNILSSTHP